MTALPMQHQHREEQQHERRSQLAPGTAVDLASCGLVRPGLDLHRGAGRQRRDTDRAARRAMVAEPLDVGLVERRERVHVGQEAQRLGDVGQRRADRGQLRRARLLDGLRGLGGDAAVDERAVAASRAGR